jgi:molybdopterin converting factor small subunit
LSIKIHIHKIHRHLTDGLDVVEVEGDTVRTCLSHLIKRFPGIEKELFDKNGKLRNIIEVYINAESAYPDELAKPVNDGDTMHLTIVLAGG